MRNLLMMKLGTPIGAGPGRPSEKVGFARVGTPSARRMSPAPPDFSFSDSGVSAWTSGLPSDSAIPS